MLHYSFFVCPYIFLLYLFVFSRRRTTRSNAVNSLSRSIAETETEFTDENETGISTHEAESPISERSSSEEETKDKRHPTTFSSLKARLRSPYGTRSTSKSRTTFSSSYASSSSSMSQASPTKALTFIEGDDEDDTDGDVASPRRSNRRYASVPVTPGQIEAHDDADVYQQDCCDSHDVVRPDGTILYRRHAHGHSHVRSTSRPTYEATLRPEVAQSGPKRDNGLLWYILLSLLMVSLLGPWAVKQITDRPPSFIGEKGQNGAVMTQGRKQEAENSKQQADIE